MKPDARALFVFLAFAFSSPAHAQQSAAPVTINSCTPDLNNSPTTQTIAGLPLMSSSDGMKIEFVNESKKTADLINFDVDSNGTRFVIRDVGTFSPGVSIVHRYRNGEGQAFILPQFIAPKVTCTVASVRFTDGTSWAKGQPQTSAPPAALSQGHLSATPSRMDIDQSTESNLFFVSSKDRITAFKESDDCSGIAAVFVAATGQSTATYSVKPLASGRCAAQITDEDGHTLSVPITVH